MSKANPSVPEHLDNPELARDIRALAMRIEEQAHRYTLERRTNNLAALFIVGFVFNNFVRDLRLIADHVQPASTPGAGGRPSSGAPAVGDGQVLRRSTLAADVECGGTLAYEVMGGAIRVHRDGVYRTRCQKCGDEEGAVVTAGLSSLDEARG